MYHIKYTYKAKQLKSQNVRNMSLSSSLLLLKTIPNSQKKFSTTTKHVNKASYLEVERGFRQ